MAAALRGARGAGVGLAVVALAALVHVLAGGCAPDPIPLLLGTVGTAGVAILLSGHEWTLLRLCLVLAGGQAALHMLFMSTCGPDAVSAVDPLGSAMAMPAPSPVSPAPYEPTAMLAAHALAVVVLALVLRRGERWALDLVAALTRPWLRRPRRTPPPLPTAARAALPDAPDLRPSAVLLRGSLWRRGPPPIATTPAAVACG